MSDTVLKVSKNQLTAVFQNKEKVKSKKAMQ
jgi:hypothetical protein